jgi:Uma2 family endonuclease
LARPLADHVERLGLGTVLIAPLDVVLGEYDVVQPDIIFVSRAHEQRIVRRGIEGAPDLVVEVLSDGTSSRDCIVKRDLYARSGIGEYWIVDPQERSVMVLVLEGGNYRVHCHARSTARIGSVVLPELELVPLDIFD